MEQINLNTIPGIEMYPIIHVSQGDVGRQFKINLYNDEGEVVLDGTESLSITGYKADGNVFIYNLPSVTGSELTISTEEQMTAAKGECICEISVVKDATKIGTANFIMQVEANPSAQGPISTSALDVIDALLQSAQEDIETASSAASTATTAATDAANSATSAASSASNAASSASNASNYANVASQSATNAASSASSASTSATNAASSASDAASSATSAASAVSSVSADASSARTSAANAETYASNAATSASNASDSATAAAASASSASDSASSASTSATNAASSATAASTSETNAANNATSAASSASDAYDSANNALSSASSASTSATNAASSASSASTSATNAASSASDASDSATNASTSATNAANNATSAASSASDAASSASDAASSASSASIDASSARTSAANAETYASNAATSASNASDSAAAAAASASSANTSATNAAASETKIANMTVSAQSVSYNEEAEVVKTVVGDVYNLDFKIPKGQPMSGHEVEANPSGEATSNLTKLGIDGTIYNLAGGSEVIANPSGASTGGNLTKLGINGVNYDLAGGSEVIVNPPGEFANTYINTLKINEQTYGIINTPPEMIKTFEINPSKLLDYNNNVIADFSGKAQTYSITSNISGEMTIVFETCSWSRDSDGDYITSFFPKSFYATYVQVNRGYGYEMQVTTQPPTITRVTNPVNLGAVKCSIPCILRNDSLYVKIYNYVTPILKNGAKVSLNNLSIKYCVDNYEDGVIRKDSDFKLYITSKISVSVGDVITVDYSQSFGGPKYIIEDTNNTTVYTTYNIGNRPIITDYPTFN